MTRAWRSRGGGVRQAEGSAARRGERSGGGPEAGCRRAGDATAWLDLVMTLMRTPEEERRAVREELESHLAERVRDLVLGGESEGEATARAIGELGDAARLARRFDEAIEPSKRRFAMQVAAMCLAGTAVLFSGIAVVSIGARGSAVEVAGAARGAGGPSGAVAARERSAVEGGARFGPAGGPGVPSSRFVPPEGPAEHLLATTTAGQAGEMTLGELLARLEGTPRKVLVRWDRFESVGVRRDEVVRVAEAGATVGSVLRELALEMGPNAPAVGEREGVLVVAPRSFLDKLEQDLVVYDLSGLAAQHGGEVGASVEQICTLVTALAEPEAWVDNGGDVARLTRYEGRVFVTAPPRVHARVAWVLGELSRGAAVGPVGGAAAGTAAR